jgi:hypothetical protein
MSRRPTERNLRKQLDELRGDDAATPYEWLEQYVVARLGAGDVEIETGPAGATDPEPVPDDEVLVYVATNGERYSVPREHLPAWIDEDEDLPIHGTEDRRNPFVLADFTDTST